MGCDVFRRGVILYGNHPHARFVVPDIFQIDDLNLQSAVGAEIGFQIRAIMGHGPLGGIRIDELGLAGRGEECLGVWGLVGRVALDRAIEDVEGV